jgi:hypothetical protein
VQGTHETPQEIGDVGHPAIVAGIELKSSGGLRPSFSSHVRWCERGAPVWICGTRDRLQGEAFRILPIDWWLG